MAVRDICSLCAKRLLIATFDLDWLALPMSAAADPAKTESLPADGLLDGSSQLSPTLKDIQTTPHSPSPMRPESLSHAMSSKAVPAVRCAARTPTPCNPR